MMQEKRKNVKAISDDGKVYETRFLEIQQLSMIDEALCSLGDFGEVRLVVEKGRLRFLVTQQSYDALNWKSGTMPRQEPYG